MQRLTELGDRIRQRWDSKGYAEAELPEIAAAAIADAQLDRTFDVAEFLGWFARQSSLPEQTFGPFSDFPLQVFQSDRFYIELLFWTNSTTTIHQHAFAGAFSVLAGSSVHTEWTFDLAEQLHPEVCVGALAQKKLELLTVGSTRLIRPGKALIHSLFHLDNPSITLVVRTPGLPSAMPQWDYCAPFGERGVAFRPQLDPVFERKRQCLTMLAASGSRAIEPFLAETVESTGDAIQLAKLLVTASMLLPDASRLAGLFEQVRARFGTIVDLIGAVAQESHRVALLEGARRIFIGGPAARQLDPGVAFFFGLLMNVRSRSQLIELCARRYPNEPPAELVARWARAVVAVAPRAFGTPMTEDAIVVLERLVSGESIRQIATTPAAAVACQALVDAPAFRGLLWDARLAAA